MQTVTASELRTMRQNKEDFRVVGVLDPSAFNQKHLGGSSNIPISDPAFEQRVEEKLGSKGRKVVVYCASAKCDASEKAATRLEAAGFTNVVDFAGGLSEWETAGYRVKGEAVPPTPATNKENRGEGQRGKAPATGPAPDIRLVGA